jgi:hypothetical protein
MSSNTSGDVGTWASLGLAPTQQSAPLTLGQTVRAIGAHQPSPFIAEYIAPEVQRRQWEALQKKLNEAPMSDAPLQPGDVGYALHRELAALKAENATLLAQLRTAAQAVAQARQDRAAMAVDYAAISAKLIAAQGVQGRPAPLPTGPSTPPTPKTEGQIKSEALGRAIGAINRGWVPVV